MATKKRAEMGSEADVREARRETDRLKAGAAEMSAEERARWAEFELQEGVKDYDRALAETAETLRYFAANLLRDFASARFTSEPGAKPMDVALWALNHLQNVAHNLHPERLVRAAQQVEQARARAKAAAGQQEG